MIPALNLYWFTGSPSLSLSLSLSLLPSLSPSLYPSLHVYLSQLFDTISADPVSTLYLIISGTRPHVLTSVVTCTSGQALCEDHQWTSDQCHHTGIHGNLSSAQILSKYSREQNAEKKSPNSCIIDLMNSSDILCNNNILKTCEYHSSSTVFMLSFLGESKYNSMKKEHCNETMHYTQSIAWFLFWLTPNILYLMLLALTKWAQNIQPGIFSTNHKKSEQWLPLWRYSIRARICVDCTILRSRNRNIYAYIIKKAGRYSSDTPQT